MTAPPEHLADRPATAADSPRPSQEFADAPALEDGALGLDAYGPPHDLLSELLRSVRLRGEWIVAYAPLPTLLAGDETHERHDASRRFGLAINSRRSCATNLPASADS